MGACSSFTGRGGARRRRAQARVCRRAHYTRAASSRHRRRPIDGRRIDAQVRQPHAPPPPPPSPQRRHAGSARRAHARVFFGAKLLRAHEAELASPPRIKALCLGPRGGRGSPSRWGSGPYPTHPSAPRAAAARARGQQILPSRETTKWPRMCSAARRPSTASRTSRSCPFWRRATRTRTWPS